MLEIPHLEDFLVLQPRVKYADLILGTRCMHASRSLGACRSGSYFPWPSDRSVPTAWIGIRAVKASSPPYGVRHSQTCARSGETLWS